MTAATQVFAKQGVELDDIEVRGLVDEYQQASRAMRNLAMRLTPDDDLVMRVPEPFTGSEP